MAVRSATLRKLPPNTRKFVRLCDELQSVLTRLKNMRPVIQDLEMSARAEVARELHQASKKVPDICDLSTCPFSFKMPAPGSQECNDCGRNIQ